MLEERVKQFRCSPEFHPYLIEVLQRLPEDVLHEEVLADPRLEIVSIAPDNYGRCLSLPSPVEHLIILNEMMLTQPKTEIIHTIVHELAHKASNGKGTGLREKDAEDLLRAWGFAEESQAVRYLPALIQIDGYRMGFEWASRQEELSEFEEFYEEWEYKGFSQDRFDQFTELVMAKPIPKEIGPAELEPNELLLEQVLGSSQLKIAMGFGIMRFLAESHRQATADPSGNGGREKTGAVYCQCEWCGRDIKYGNACLTVCRNIEQVDWDAEANWDECTMIDSQTMLRLCASCGNHLDHGELTKALADSQFSVPRRNVAPCQIEGS